MTDLRRRFHSASITSEFSWQDKDKDKDKDKEEVEWRSAENLGCSRTERRALDVKALHAT